MRRALLHAVLAASIVLGGASVAEMIVIEALFGAARAFFQPAYSGLLPQTIPDGEAQDARALSSSTENLAILIGPALGAVLVLTVGAGAAFALDAATFLLSAELLRHIRPRVRGEIPQVPQEGTTVLADLRAGWYEVRSRTWVWATIAAFAVAVLSAYAQWYALAPLVSKRALRRRGRVRPARERCRRRRRGRRPGRHPLAARAIRCSSDWC